MTRTRARRLGISQPALSAQLARLRAIFDDPLLVPSGRQMVPSAPASAIRAPLRHYLDELQALVPNRLVFDPHTRPRTFRIRGTEFRVLMCWHHPQQHRDPGSQWLRDNLSAALAAGEMVGEPARPVPAP